MELVTDIFFALVSRLPKIFSWWLYSPERTVKNVEVFISAQEGSVEIWCDEAQASFKVIPEFKNSNPFPIDIDRVEISGQLHNASIKAFELLGAKLEKNKKVNLYPRGKLDESSLKRVNQAADDEALRLEVRIVIINKYHYIRDFSCHFDRLMCKFYNKKSNRSIEGTRSSERR